MLRSLNILKTHTKCLNSKTRKTTPTNIFRASRPSPWQLSRSYANDSSRSEPSFLCLYRQLVKSLFACGDIFMIRNLPREVKRAHRRAQKEGKNSRILLNRLKVLLYLAKRVEAFPLDQGAFQMLYRVSRALTWIDISKSEYNSNRADYPRPKTSLPTPNKTSSLALLKTESLYRHILRPSQPLSSLSHPLSPSQTLSYLLNPKSFKKDQQKTYKADRGRLSLEKGYFPSGPRKREKREKREEIGEEIGESGENEDNCIEGEELEGLTFVDFEEYDGLCREGGNEAYRWTGLPALQYERAHENEITPRFKFEDMEGMDKGWRVAKGMGVVIIYQETD